MKKKSSKRTSKIRKITTKYKKVFLVVIFVSIIIAAFIFVFTRSESFRNVNKDYADSKTLLPTVPVYPTIQPISTENWKTYSNRVYGFTIQYPPDYILNCHECEQVDDDVEWSTSHISFTPAHPFSHESIWMSFSDNLQNPPNPNESIEQYMQRISSDSKGDIESLTQKTKVGSYDGLQEVSEYGNNIYLVKNYFLFGGILGQIGFSENVYTELEMEKMTRPIYEFPNIQIYHQMLKTFKPADLPQTRKITSLYQPSPDGSFYIRAKQAGHGEQIILVDNKGEIITMQSFYSNRELFPSIRCYECGIRFGRWIDNYQFAVRLVGAYMNDDDTIRSGEYEYVIDARTGEIVPNSLKQIK